jgi:hypothetical protein
MKAIKKTCGWRAGVAAFILRISEIPVIFKMVIPQEVAKSSQLSAKKVSLTTERR